MAKKKSNSKKGLENDLRKLHDYIDSQNFENIEELESFLNQMTGKKIDDIVPTKQGKISEKEESRELVYEAYETTKVKGKKLAHKALKLDPNNVEAYNYLGSIEPDILIAMGYYKKGMDAGKKEIGEEGFKEMSGHFWGVHETRPFMRAKVGYSECLYLLGRYSECMNQYSEMIELNPNDNQGVRYKYASMLVANDKFLEYEKLRTLYKEISALWLFTYAIYLFKKEGNCLKANNALQNAHQSNNHVIPYLLGKKELPETIPEYYGWGDENEAVIYLIDSGKLWLETDKAIGWLTDFYSKKIKLN